MRCWVQDEKKGFCSRDYSLFRGGGVKTENKDTIYRATYEIYLLLAIAKFPWDSHVLHNMGISRKFSNSKLRWRIVHSCRSTGKILNLNWKNMWREKEEIFGTFHGAIHGTVTILPHTQGFSTSWGQEVRAELSQITREILLIRRCTKKHGYQF